MSMSDALRPGAGRRVEHQPRRIGFAADAERMHLQRRFAFGDGRADFQHVRAQHLLARLGSR